MFLKLYILLHNICLRHRKLSWPGVAYWLRHSATSRTVSGSIPGGVAGDFSVATDGTMCPGVDSASKTEYQGFLLR